MKKLKTEKGFTLVELLVTMAIFILLFSTISSLYFFNQKYYSGSEDSAEITQNGRVVLERISRELRQAKQITTVLPTENVDAPSEITFQDGHAKQIIEQNNSRASGAKQITLSLSSSSVDDYYKDLYVKIISGTGAGQVRKIYSYDGASKIAYLDKSWTTIPDISSVYLINSSFYYVKYYRTTDSNILKKVFTYCFSSNGTSCLSPETYIIWNSTPPEGQSLLEVVLEEPQIVGEYVTNLDFWGSLQVNMLIQLEKNNKTLDMETQIFGRNF